MMLPSFPCVLNTNVICESSLITKNITELAKILLCAIIRWSLVSNYLAIYKACKIILACSREENTYIILMKLHRKCNFKF